MSFPLHLIHLKPGQTLEEKLREMSGDPLLEIDPLAEDILSFIAQHKASRDQDDSG
jgi:hypothetical protein